MRRGETKGSRRLVVGIVLFGASFGIGLALTYALISSGTNQVVVEPGGDSADVSSKEKSRAPSVAIAPMNTPQGLPGVTSAPVPPAPTPPTPPKDTVINTPDTDTPDSKTDTPPGMDVEEKKDEIEVAANQPSSKETTPANVPAWKELKGKTCRVGLAEVGFQSLSLRRGKLRHGAKVSWQKSFSKRRRIGRIQADANPVVQVEGIGLDKEGQPAVAYVKIVETGKKGVISLQVEGKQIQLFPILGKDEKSVQVN